jgi:hypothetical protein
MVLRRLPGEFEQYQNFNGFAFCLGTHDKVEQPSQQSQ